MLRPVGNQCQARGALRGLACAALLLLLQPGAASGAPEEEQCTLLQHPTERRLNLVAPRVGAEGVGVVAPHSHTEYEAKSGSITLAEYPRARDRTAGSLEQPTLDNVRKSFNSMSAQGSVLNLYKGAAFPKGYDKGYMPYEEHFEGVQRQQGGNFIYISGAGVTEGYAHLFVYEVQSKAGGGLVKVVRFDKEYTHGGGLNIFGDYLVIGAEMACGTMERMMGTCASRSRIHFFDISNPANPVKLPYTVERSDGTAGAVSLTRDRDGRFVLLVGRTDSYILDFYHSDGTSLDTDPGFGKRPLLTWYKESVLTAAGQNAVYGDYQNLGFVREASGDLYMVGTCRTNKGLGTDYADLFKVDLKGGKVTITKVGSRSFSCQHMTCNFEAGAGLYLPSSKQMVLYAVNWEPDNSKKKVQVSEFA